tara:strand:- start:11830 stop:13380 length:1551 start_codon:yes stop_codon:yes gene_type:complete
MRGIILGCLQANPGWQGPRGIQEPNWVNLKRSGGAHKIATYMRKEGWDIEVLDYWLAFTDEEFQEFIKSRVTQDTKFIGVSVTFGYKFELLERAINNLNWVKQHYPDITIIAGSKALVDTMNLPCDYYVIGYGEKGLIELLKGTATITEFMQRKVVMADRHHPCFPEKDLVVQYEDRDFIQQTDNLTLELSRGCKFKCKFCSYNAIGMKGDLTRAMETLYPEMLYNYETYGVTSYHVADETTNDNQDKIKLAGQEIQKLPFRPNLTGFIRADLLASRPDDKVYLAEMGFWAQYYGIESFNQKAGSVVGKGMNTDRLKAGLLEAKDYFNKHCGRYRASASLILGLPYETNESLWEGLRWWKTNMPNENMILQPLYINRFQMEELNSSSEFGRTWQTSGHFHSEEDTSELLDSELTEFENNPGLKEYIRRTFDRQAMLHWSHDTYNWKTACIELGRVFNTGMMYDNRIMTWDLFNFVTPGTYDWDSVLDITVNNYDLESLRNDTNLFIQRYKDSKLSL